MTRFARETSPGATSSFGEPSMFDRLHDHVLNATAGGLGLVMLSNLDLAVKILGLIVAFIGVGLSISKECRQWLDRVKQPKQ